MVSNEIVKTVLSLYKKSICIPHSPPGQLIKYISQLSRLVYRILTPLFIKHAFLTSFCQLLGEMVLIFRRNLPQEGLL
jgi:hypothetical protein